MSLQHVDAYGHLSPIPNSTVLTAGAVSTTAAGTIAPTTNAGAAPTVTAVGTLANDHYGSFQLNPVTGGGAQAAGAQVVVTFANPFRQAPSFVRVQVIDITTAAAPVIVAAYPVTITANGFSIETAALTTAHNYLVNYNVEL